MAIAGNRRFNPAYAAWSVYKHKARGAGEVGRRGCSFRADICIDLSADLSVLSSLVLAFLW